MSKSAPERIASNLSALRERVEAACQRAQRSPSEITLVAVTKNRPPDDVASLIQLGVRRIGENRIQEAAGKRLKFTTPDEVLWECIGPIQSNKSHLAVEIFDRIQSVDRPKILERLDRHAGELGKSLPILLQVNAGLDPNKHGVHPEEATALLELAMQCTNLRVEGLMTIAPLSEEPAVARQTFANLRQLRDHLQDSLGTPLPTLSMGMTGDLEEAILEGSTCIRVGTALFQ